MKYNNIKPKILVLSLIFSQFNTITTIGTSVYAQEKLDSFESSLYYDEEFPYDEASFNLLVQSEKFLYEYCKSLDVSYLYKSIDNFCEIIQYIPNDKDGLLYDDYNLQKLFLGIRTQIYKIEDSNKQSVCITYFGEKLFLGWRKNKDLLVFRDNYLRLGLVYFNNNSKSQDRLNYLLSLSIYFSGNHDLDNDSNSDIIPNIEIPSSPDIVLPDIEEDKPNPAPIEPMPDVDNSNNNVVVELENTSFYTEYVKKGNLCYEKTTSYKDGVAISEKESLVQIEDYVKCGIYTYVHLNNSDKEVDIDRDYIYNNQNKDSEYTIHFTVNKSAKNPKYYNTGIRAESSIGSVTYNQLKDTLYQMAIKAEGFSVLDNDKFLCIVEGKPIVLKKNINTYAKSTVEQLLNEFVNVGLAIFKPNESNANSLKDYVLDKDIKTIKLDGNDEGLKNPLMIIDNQLYAPVEDIMDLLGAKTVVNGKELKITKGKTIITLSVNSKSYYVNGRERMLISSPILQDSIIYSQIDSILSDMGYELIWDSVSSELSINKLLDN